MQSTARDAPGPAAVQASSPAALLHDCLKATTCSLQGEAENLESVWDFTPPGDLGSSGAWTVVRELALTLSRRGALSFLEKGMTFYA